VKGVFFEELGKADNQGGSERLLFLILINNYIRSKIKGIGLNQAEEKM
jgi:hypothetical protein